MVFNLFIFGIIIFINIRLKVGCDVSIFKVFILVLVVLILKLFFFRIVEREYRLWILLFMSNNCLFMKFKLLDGLVFIYFLVFGVLLFLFI